MGTFVRRVGTPLILAITLTLFPAVAHTLGAQDSDGQSATRLSVGTATGASDRSVEPDLVALRQVAERFRDVDVALAEGYVPDPMNVCETAETLGRPAELGAMGIHYFRPDLLGITAPPNPRVAGDGVHTDFRVPSILIYEPQADGSMELVAVENLVFEDAWEAAGNSAPPSYRGVTYDHMVDDPATEIDEAHMFEPHYDLHAWVFRENPNGAFAQFNPNVSCEHHRPTGASAPRRG